MSSAHKKYFLCICFVTRQSLTYNLDLVASGKLIAFNMFCACCEPFFFYESPLQQDRLHTKQWFLDIMSLWVFDCHSFCLINSVINHFHFNFIFYPYNFFLPGCTLYKAVSFCNNLNNNHNVCIFVITHKQRLKTFIIEYWLLIASICLFN